MSAHHTLVPDDGHPLLSAIGALWDEGEVVFAHSSLRGVKGTVSTASYLQITTVHHTDKHPTQKIHSKEETKM